MIRYAYDIECFINLFTATFVNVEDKSDVKVFCIGLDKNELSDMTKFLNTRMTLIGYNNHSYDDPMLRFIMSYGSDNLLPDLFSLSSKLVDDNYRRDDKILELRYPRKSFYKWDSIDLMKILAFDKLGISLKQTAINLKWHKIQDIPVDPNQKIKENQLEMITNYNLNDVLITIRLYEEIAPIRELRDELSKIYSINLSSASDSKVANLILENIYSNELKLDIRAIRDMRTHRDKVFLGECIASFVEFKTPQLNETLDRISSRFVYNYNKYRYSEKIYFANCTFNLGIGGLHTEDSPGVFVTDDKYIIQDMDVSSYYPNLIINNNFYPQHLGVSFIKVLKKITEERIAAKKAGDKIKADGLKITINSIFGKMGSETFWLEDAKQMLSTTLTGQLGLLMLVEELFTNGIEVLSCNTDGIVCKIPRELEKKYYQIAKDWEKRSRLELEFTPYKKYVRRDVNSYITEKMDGTTKEKGAFLKEVDLKKAYHMPIVPKALYAYFMKGIPVKQTLEECKDIMEFCISQKTGGNFILEFHTPKGIEELQKTNRYYVAKKGGVLIKRDLYSKRRIGLQVKRQVRILNDYNEKAPFESYDVDLSFYEKEVMKIVDEIEPKQLGLFDLSSLGQSSLTKMGTANPEKESAPVEKVLSLKELNKLGKNQFAKKIESIVENNQRIEKISPKYAYVESFNPSDMYINIYCLSRGTYYQLYVDKTAYKKEKIMKGHLIYCKKFRKDEYGFTLMDYKITEKIEEKKEQLL